MADINKTIEIIFGAVDNTSGAFTHVGKGLQDMEDSIGNITGPLASVTDTLIKTEAAVAAVGVALLAVAYTSAVEFDSAIVDLGKQLEGGINQAESYKKSIFDLSETFGVSAIDITQSFADFSQAGFDTDKAFSLVAATLEQVKVSELSAAESAEFLIRIMKGFGEEGFNVNRALDLINETTNNYAVNTGKLSEALARTSSVASGAGLSLEETIGILTPMIEKTQSAELSSTAFNTALQRMTSLNSEVAKGFDILGISQTGLNGDLKSGNEILREAQGAFNGLSDSNKALAVQYLVGQENASKFRVVLEQGNKTLEITKVALAGVGTSLEKELNVRMKSAQIQIDQTKVAFENLAIAIGGQFKIQATGAVDAVGLLTNTFRTLIDNGKLEPFFKQLRPLLAGFEQDIRDIAEALPEAFDGIDFTVVTRAFEELGRAVSDLFGNVDLTTPEGLRKAIQELFNIGGGLIQVTAGIVEGITPFIQKVAELGSKFGELNPGTQQFGGNILGIGKAINTILPALGSVGAGLESVGTGLTVIGTSGIIKTLSGLTKGFVATGAAAGTLTAASATAGVGLAALAGGGIGTLWSTIVNKLIPGVDTIGTKLYDLVNPAEESGAALGKMSFNANDAGVKLKTTAAAISSVVAPLEKLALGEGGLTGALVASTEKIKEQEDALFTIDEAFGLTGESVAVYNQELETTEKQGNSLIRVVTDSETGLKTYSQTVDLTAESLDKQTEKTKIVKEETDQFRISMEKIASDERIKNIEAKISLDIANVEANAKIVTAAFESIDTGIESTGKLIGDLFGVLLDANSWAQRRLIEEQLEKENDRRDQSFKLQKELTEAEISLIKQKTKRLAKGDALIKINGDGLAPQLEAFMWEVLNAIQVRANAEGSEFLLGVA